MRARIPACSQLSLHSPSLRGILSFSNEDDSCDDDADEVQRASGRGAGATSARKRFEQGSDADFERLVAAPLMESVLHARKNRGPVEGSISDMSSSVPVADDDGGGGGGGERVRMMNPTLLVGGEYRPLGPVSECVDVDEIEQVKSQTPNPKPQTPNPKPHTPNPNPQTPNPKPQTPNPKP